MFGNTSKKLQEAFDKQTVSESDLSGVVSRNTKIKSFFNAGRKIHVIGFIDDLGTELMVVKYYLKSKKEWMYNTSTVALFDEYVADGKITDIN